MHTSSETRGSYTGLPDTRSRAPINAVGTGAAWSASLGMHELLADLEALIVSTSVLSGAELTAATARLRERCAAVRQSVDELGGGC